MAEKRKNTNLDLADEVYDLGVVKYGNEDGTTPPKVEAIFEAIKRIIIELPYSVKGAYRNTKNLDFLKEEGIWPMGIDILETILKRRDNGRTYQRNCSQPVTEYGRPNNGQASRRTLHSHFE